MNKPTHTKVIRVPMSVRKRKLIIPYTGKKVNENCIALRFNYALFTQCTNKAVLNIPYCKTCAKHVEDNSGLSPYGTIDDRLEYGILDYVDPTGRKTAPLYKVLKRMKVTRDEMEEECKNQGVLIPPEHWGEQSWEGGISPKASEKCDEVLKYMNEKEDTKINEFEVKLNNELKNKTGQGRKGRPKKEYSFVDAPEKEEIEVNKIEYEIWKQDKGIEMEADKKRRKITNHSSNLSNSPIITCITTNPDAQTNVSNDSPIDVEEIEIDGKLYYVSNVAKVVYDIDTEEDIGFVKHDNEGNMYVQEYEFSDE